MQEQKFEKQVRNKLEELSFTPSEPVWDKVEEQIRKKKDRRRFIFWLLPFILLSGSIYFLTGKTQRDIVSNPTFTKAAKPAKKQTNNESESRSIINTPDKETTDRQMPANMSSKNSLHHQSTPPKRLTVYSRIIPVNVGSTEKVYTENKHNEVSVLENGVESSKQKNTSNETTIDTITAKSSEGLIDSANYKPIIDSTTKMEIIHDDTAIAKTSIELRENEASAAQKRIKKKWGWGIYSSMGISNISTKPFAPFNGAKAKSNQSAMDYFARPSSMSQLSNNTVC